MSPDTRTPGNTELSNLLDSIADALEATGEAGYRLGAYRRAARAIGGQEESVARRFADSGAQGLEDIPGVGSGIAAVLAEYLQTGRSSLLDDLRAEADPAALFSDLPGVGPQLAGRLVEELGAESLEDLELAAHDGRLEGIEGIGPAKAEGIRDVLAGRLSRSGRRRGGDRSSGSRPPVSLILEVDTAYRQAARRDALRRIAPKRFNPAGEAWLPVMNEERQGWRFTVLFSNTRRAHDLGKTRDWVVVYYTQAEGGSSDEGQCTVVTGSHGDLAGRRLVRGREEETRRHYEGAGDGGS